MPLAAILPRPVKGSVDDVHGEKILILPSMRLGSIQVQQGDADNGTHQATSRQHRPSEKENQRFEEEKEATQCHAIRAHKQQLRQQRHERQIEGGEQNSEQEDNHQGQSLDDPDMEAADNDNDEDNMFSNHVVPSKPATKKLTYRTHKIPSSSTMVTHSVLHPRDMNNSDGEEDYIDAPITGQRSPRKMLLDLKNPHGPSRTSGSKVRAEISVMRSRAGLEAKPKNLKNKQTNSRSASVRLWDAATIVAERERTLESQNAKGGTPKGYPCVSASAYLLNHNFCNSAIVAKGLILIEYERQRHGSVRKAQSDALGRGQSDLMWVNTDSPHLMDRGARALARASGMLAMRGQVKFADRSPDVVVLRKVKKRRISVVSKLRWAQGSSSANELDKIVDDDMYDMEDEDEAAGTNNSVITTPRHSITHCATNKRRHDSYEELEDNDGVTQRDLSKPRRSTTTRDVPAQRITTTLMEIQPSPYTAYNHCSFFVP
ncbi:hypothetical protein BV22DRAFT_1051927 [Leucogyrophana mollusca]|uniref:Uncharacterized protein n=1 Tax=Leucogyrophana mollusca TaxID=85980 RepID=A0ACB8AZY5_9AGAM|nr:hypothetical protein BV22DRAFT_1051927 [Leucogyrophana mollusca]